MLHNREFVKRTREKLRRDLGPLITAALDDPRTIEVMLNPDGKLWQERLDEPMRCIGEVKVMAAFFIILVLAIGAFPLAAAATTELLTAIFIVLLVLAGRTAPRIAWAISGHIMMGAGLWVVAMFVAAIENQPNRGQVTTGIAVLTAVMCALRLYQEWEERRRGSAGPAHAARRR